MDASNPQEVHLSHYWNIIQKRWKVAVSIFLVVMVGTFLASHFAKPLYRSVIQLQIERENPNQLTIEDLFGIEASEQEFLQTQYVLLQSRGLGQRVIDDHQLLSDSEFYPPGIKGKSPEEVRRIRDSMVPALVSGVAVRPVKGTSLVEVSYVATSPRLAQKIAEGWGHSFIHMKIGQKLDNVNQASAFLRQQIIDIQRDLDKARAELQRYGQSKDIVSVEGGSESGSISRVEQVSSDLVSAQNDRIAKQAAYESIKRSNPESVTSNDPLVAQITSDLSRLQGEYNDKLGRLLPQHPQMVRLREQLDQTRRSRANAIGAGYGKALEAARTAWSAASTNESSLRGALANQRQEAIAQNANAVRYNDLKTLVDTKLTLLSTLQTRLSETQVAAALRGSNSSNIHWIDHAEVPRGRFNVNMRKNMQSALPLGIVLGLAAIFFLEYMDRSIKSPEELERITKFASLGVIPAANSVSKSGSYAYGGRGNLRAVAPPAEDGSQQGIDLLPHLDSRSAIAESYRAFRTSLLLASANSPKVIVITSSFAREGKTTTSVNLATVLAQMGKPVLLIDADLRRPRLQKVFRGKMNLGLVNYLAASAPLEHVVQETVIPHLSVVLSGPTPPNPSELLSSDRMKQLIHEVRTKFAYVIFDSPPVLAVTDAIVLAASADGVVLCVHGGQTPRELVQRSADRLRQSNIPVLGALLNNLDLQQYGYTYKKSYYDYYDSAEAPPQDAPAARKTV
jgi:capsular exopolysaccharide synthesis family protein